MARPGRRATRADAAELAGAPPQLATVAGYAGANDATTNGHARQRAAKQPDRINLRSVAEACIEHGLDPASEIARALTLMVPLVRHGVPVMDEHGQPVMVPAVDMDTRLRVAGQLLEYTQPKLKSTEVKVSGALELSGDQLDARIAALLSKGAA